MRNRKQRNSENYQPLTAGKSWSTTFSDLLLLLLTFFALKLSASGVSATSFKMELEQVTPPPLAALSNTSAYSNISLVERLNLEGLEYQAGTKLTVSKVGDSELIHVSLEDGCFVHGLADLTFKSEVVLNALSQFALNGQANFEIRTVPSAAEVAEIPFLSSWDLAQSRAVQVVRQMIDGGVDSSAIRVAGTGLRSAVISDSIKRAKTSEGCLSVLVKPSGKTSKS